MPQLRIESCGAPSCRIPEVGSMHAHGAVTPYPSIVSNVRRHATHSPNEIQSSKASTDLLPLGWSIRCAISATSVDPRKH